MTFPLIYWPDAHYNGTSTAPLILFMKGEVAIRQTKILDIYCNWIFIMKTCLTSYIYFAHFQFYQIISKFVQICQFPLVNSF